MNYDQLVTDNMGFVVSLAQEYHNKYRKVELDDFVSEGTLAMLHAARKWDPQRGVRFVNYAVRDVRKAMERLIPEDIITTEAVPEKLKAGKPHTDDSAEQGDLEASIFPALKYLSEREQYVISAYYGLDVDDRMTMAEIADEMLVTRSRVRQIRKTAERKMKRLLNHNVFILLLVMLISTVATSVKAENAYIYGIAYSPTDSVVYMTDIRMLENVTIQKKTNFLASRGEYASQMKRHLEGEGIKDYICATVYKPTYKAIYKDYVKLKKQYEKRGILISIIDQLKFNFQPIIETK